MPTHIALLRAVNVGGRFVKMADLRSCLEASGLEEVETYIQSGNVRFTSPMRSRTTVARHVEEALRGGCGFEVPAVVLSPAELVQVADDAAALPSPLEGDGVRRYVMFLKEEPARLGARAVDGWDVDGERARVLGRAVHIWVAKPTHEARLGNNRLERDLGVGTTRDLKVVRSMAERWAP
jgi:uncharacterized protein (DUF1697 family)